MENSLVFIFIISFGYLCHAGSELGVRNPLNKILDEYSGPSTTTKTAYSSGFDEVPASPNLSKFDSTGRPKWLKLGARQSQSMNNSQVNPSAPPPTYSGVINPPELIDNHEDLQLQPPTGGANHFLNPFKSKGGADSKGNSDKDDAGNTLTVSVKQTLLADMAKGCIFVQLAEQS